MCGVSSVVAHVCYTSCEVSNMGCLMCDVSCVVSPVVCESGLRFECCSMDGCCTEMQ